MNSPIHRHTQQEPTHLKEGTTIIRHPDQIAREKAECAYFLRVVWAEICGEEETIKLESQPGEV